MLFYKELLSYFNKGLFLFQHTLQALCLPARLPLSLPPELAQLPVSRRQLLAELLQLARSFANHLGEPIGAVLRRSERQRVGWLTWFSVHIPHCVLLLRVCVVMLLQHAYTSLALFLLFFI